jgi:hypothetical protein
MNSPAIIDPWQGTRPDIRLSVQGKPAKDIAFSE